MVNLLLRCLRIVLQYPNVHVAFEWPHAAAGWRHDAVQRLCKLLPTQSLIDGCRFKVQDQHGHLLKKTWRIQTDVAELQNYLTRRCLGDHEHGECRGDTALQSGFYTSVLAKHILRAIVQCGSCQGQAYAVEQAVPGPSDAGARKSGLKLAVMLDGDADGQPPSRHVSDSVSVRALLHKSMDTRGAVRGSRRAGGIGRRVRGTRTENPTQTRGLATSATLAPQARARAPCSDPPAHEPLSPPRILTSTPRGFEARGGRGRGARERD